MMRILILNDFFVGWGKVGLMNLKKKKKLISLINESNFHLTFSYHTKNEIAS